ncbi:histidine ammonia-lyase [[Phormidium] sp. ETS-05]|uniref:HAL/PAL/TAL family ammonia-lyase n=1 Tax=[Phormidium] sp. ETS-05 TaxID=222819 RepID=UPI0018EEEC62|nr:aromatic amino acid ammonia-lyase [[Phormidium] sp. ETS-05]
MVHNTLSKSIVRQFEKSASYKAHHQLNQPKATKPHRKAAQFACGLPVSVAGQNLTLDDVVQVAQGEASVKLSVSADIRCRIDAACDFISGAVANGQPIYGVNTGFGGMANTAIAPEDAAALQENLVAFLKSGAGNRLSVADVRAGMLLRMNSHLRGASGIRFEFIERMAKFLNAGVTPHVYDLGSIGASGDLVPLAYITGAIAGLHPEFTVDFQGQEMSCLEALERLDLQPLSLRPKEGLAMVNGTSVMTGIAANCTSDALELLAVALGSHALMVQALGGSNQSFHPFIHAAKPHPGQVWTAQQMLELLAGSRLSVDELNGEHQFKGQGLIQDRYSLRCLPQYLGPVVDGFREIVQQMEIEINSVTDNPLIDVNSQASYHGGNFLGQYVAVAMDRLRYFIGLIAKHLDVQIALLVAPEFNGGLSPSLVGNPERSVNMGLKGLQITGNSIMPLLAFYGNSIADRYPTHAEQYNQNINSQGFNSATLARKSVDLFQQYMAVSLIFAVQGVDKKAYAIAGHYDARQLLSEKTAKLYQAVRDILGKPPDTSRPLVWNDNEQFLDIYIARLANDIAAGGIITQAVKEVVADLKSSPISS